MGRSRIRRDYDTAQRNKRIAVIVGVVAFIALWIFIVIWVGRMGGAQPAEQAAEETTHQAPATTEQTTTSEQASGSGNEEEGSEGEDQSSGEDGPPPTHPDVPSEESPPGEWEQGEDPDGQTPLNEEQPSSEGDGSGEEGGKGQPSEQHPEEEQGSSGEEGGQHEQGFDPLGKDPEPGDLTETDRKRAEDAADRFIGAAYGYTGDSEKEYRQGVIDASLGLGLFKSPGGERIEEYAKTAGEEGITSAAEMERFRITETSENEVEGVAHFEVGKEYNRYAELKGETTPYRQRLTLTPFGESYRVSAASVESEIESKDKKDSKEDG